MFPVKDSELPCFLERRCPCGHFCSCIKYKRVETREDVFKVSGMAVRLAAAGGAGEAKQTLHEAKMAPLCL